MLLKWTLVEWKIFVLNYYCRESSFMIGTRNRTRVDGSCEEVGFCQSRWK